MITKDTVFVFEFKLDETSTVEKAVQQIDDKGYEIPYSAKGKKTVKIGVTFSKKNGGITGWKIDNKEHSESMSKASLGLSEHSESMSEASLGLSEHSESMSEVSLGLSEHSESMSKASP
jgi:hypothetical protein